MNTVHKYWATCRKLQSNRINGLNASGLGPTIPNEFGVNTTWNSLYLPYKDSACGTRGSAVSRDAVGTKKLFGREENANTEKTFHKVIHKKQIKRTEFRTKDPVI